MIFRYASSLGAIVLLALAGSAQAAPAKNTPAAQTTGTVDIGKHDTNAPISVSSDNFEGDLQTKVGTYTGNVVIVQGDFKLRADKVNVHVVNGKPSTIDGAGNVLFNSGIETASGDTGVYDLNSRIITLDGRVVLTKDKNVMRGTHLVMNMDTHKAQLTAKGMPGGGRVQGLFIPPPKNPSDKASKTQTSGKPPAK